MIKFPVRPAVVSVALMTLLACASSLYSADSPAGADDKQEALTSQARVALIRRAHLWRPTNIPKMNVRVGPAHPGAFKPDELVTCDYRDKEMTGRSPKFTCVIGPDDEVKVKFGEDNGEVYGEVATTRLLWALGFGADYLYPVRVVCRGCPNTLGGRPYASENERFFDPAAIERKMPGHELLGHDVVGWSWTELDVVSEGDGGAPKAHRDALKLLAATLQHTDSKAEQQRLLCLDDPTKGEAGKINAARGACATPFMMLNDVGLTFGRANYPNDNALGSVNFERWAKSPVWKDAKSCTADIGGSATGTLKDPVISEEGRRFLAGLLAKLTDRQLHDLFEVARFDRRSRAPHEEVDKPADKPGTATIDEWVSAFKQKRDEIASRRCS